MKHKIKTKLGILILAAIIFLPLLTLADGTTPPSGGSSGSTPATGLPDANFPSECGSKPIPGTNPVKMGEPKNCVFLEEPLGGKPNVDLFIRRCTTTPGSTPTVPSTTTCTIEPWNGGSLQSNETGPIQALLSYDPSKQQYQGSFGLFYSYIRQVYLYMSGLIVGISVLFIVIGGVQISLAGIKQENVSDGKKRIEHAIVGLIIWFTASLILYTINPTFFFFS